MEYNLSNARERQTGKHVFGTARAHLHPFAPASLGLGCSEAAWEGTCLHLQPDSTCLQSSFPFRWTMGHFSCTATSTWTPSLAQTIVHTQTLYKISE